MSVGYLIFDIRVIAASQINTILQAVRRGIKMKQFDHYIDGSWAAGSSYRDNINPSDTADIIGQFAQADVKQTESAIDAAARNALGAWRYGGIQQRHDLLEAVGAALLCRSSELGDLLAREEGKTLAEGIGEVTRAAHIFQILCRRNLAHTGRKTYAWVRCARE